MINDGSTELECFQFDEHLVSLGVLKEFVILDILEDIDYGDWIYLKLDAKKARHFAESILTACDLLKG